MDKGKAIKSLRQQAEMTQEQLAKEIGTTKQTIYKYENSIITNIPSDKIQAMARVFGVSPLTVMGINAEGHSTHSDYFRIPVLGHVAARIPIEMIEDVVDWEDLPKEKFKEPEKEYFGLKIEGHSMEPQICNNDTVIVHKQPDAEDGQIVIAAVDGEYATCKRLKKYKDSIALVPINPDYSPLVFSSEEVKNEPVTILGVVLELRRSVI